MEKYQRLSLDEREIICQQLSQGKSLRFIAESVRKAFAKELKNLPQQMT